MGMRDELLPAATHDQFCQLARASRDIVALATSEGRLLYMNGAGRHAVGLDESARLATTTLFDCLPPDQHSRVRRSLTAVAEGGPGSGDHFDLRFRHLQTGAAIPTWWQAFLLTPAHHGAEPAVALVAHLLEPRASRPPDAFDPHGLIAKEVAAMELLSAPSATTSVTAQLLGVAPLHQRAPRDYWDLFERYGHLLDLALERHAYKTAADGASNELRAIAERLGSLDAGAREVADLHARALRQKVRTASTARAQAYTAEGRLVAFELMGHLLSYYRRRGSVAPQEKRG
jgi:hypothetical protein